MDSSRRHALVGDASALLLRAISHDGAEGIDAFRRWRALTPLDDAGRGARRVLPLLVDLVEREGLDDAEVQRIKGVGRHVWTQNTLNVRILLSALDALATNGLRPMLLKGLALFVRSPDFMRKRSSTDGDILLPPEQIELAARLLREAGFEPRGFRWADFGAPLIESATSGASLRQPGQKSPLDLHWRPLSNITDPELGETVMARAEHHELQGRPILLPSVTDQLFLALARCEPWDEDESLTRLVEAHLLLSAPSAHVDWPALEALVTRYGLEATARAFLGDLASHMRLAAPEGLLSRFDAATSGEKRHEWAIRTISPDRRGEAQRWQLQRMDERARRVRHPLGLAGTKEIGLRRFGLNPATASILWQALRRRVRPGEVRDIQFLEGFSYPEATGRWSSGNWSAFAVPLTLAQREGEPVGLNVAAFLGAGPRARVAATGGLGVVSRVQARDDSATQLDLKVRPLAELGGAGLILLWLPDAMTPASANMSNDNRQLGLFIHWPWRLPARPRATGTRAAYEAFRETYRHLPLPLAIRSRLSPALAPFQGEVISHGAIPPPLPIASIKRGDVVVSGFLSDLGDIGRAGRLIRDSLLTWGVPLSEHDLGADPPGDLVPKVSPGGIWVCHCNPPETMAVVLDGSARLWADRYRIGVWDCELEQLPESWIPALACFHEIWAPSEFAAAAILRARNTDGPMVRIVPRQPSQPIAPTNYRRYLRRT